MICIIINTKDKVFQKYIRLLSTGIAMKSYTWQLTSLLVFVKHNMW